MAFTFPTDTASNPGAVHATEDGTDFYVPIREQGRQSLNTGMVSVATAGTRIQFSSQACSQIIVIAKLSNTGSVFLGGSTVSSTNYGVELKAGASFALPINNANLLYIDATVNGEGVSYVAV